MGDIHVLPDHLPERRARDGNRVRRHGQDYGDRGDRRLAHAPAERSRQQGKNEIQEKCAIRTAGKKADDRRPENVRGVGQDRKSRRNRVSKMYHQQQPHRVRQVKDQQRQDEFVVRK